MLIPICITLGRLLTRLMSQFSQLSNWQRQKGTEMVHSKVRKKYRHSQVAEGCKLVRLLASVSLKITEIP